MRHLNKNPVASKYLQGFTLIELMVVVTIIGVVAAIAYPNYTQYTLRSNRSAAQSFILGVANKQEQYILDARKYTDKLATLNMTTPSEVSKNYDITISGVATNPPTYTITATPKGTQASKDTQCKNLTIDQAGTKGRSGTGAVADCW